MESENHDMRVMKINKSVLKTINECTKLQFIIYTLFFLNRIYYFPQTKNKIKISYLLRIWRNTILKIKTENKT